MESRAEQAQGYRKEAEKYAKLAKSGQSDITNVHRTIAQRYAWMAENLDRSALRAHPCRGEPTGLQTASRPGLSGLGMTILRRNRTPSTTSCLLDARVSASG
jgi:hypothetical protein